MSHFGQITSYVAEVKKNLNDLSDMKADLVACEYEDEALVEKALELKKKCVFFFSRISSTARDLHFEVHQKEKALKEPQGKLLKAVDSLENVAYEKTQIVRQTKACNSQNVNLDTLEDIATIEEFQKSDDRLLLDESGKSIDPKTNEHKFNMRRLQFESNERRRLLKDAQEIKEEVKNTSEHIEKRQNLLNSVVNEKLNTLFKAADPLRDVFDLPRKVIPQPASAKYLPPALYAVFYSCWCQKHIHRDVDNSVSISIGNIPEAPHKKRKLSNGKGVITFSSDKPIHPVKLNIQFDAIGVKLILQYHQKLKLILTRVAIRSSKGWQVEDPRIFCKLMDGHYELPLPSNIQGSGANSCLAFSWIQSLACEYVAPESNIDDIIPVTLKQLQNCLKDRLLVQKEFSKQVQCLQKKQFIPEVQDMFNMKSTSKFTGFDYTPELRNKYYELSQEKMGEKDKNCQFFAVTFQNGSVYLQGIVKQALGYPQVLPVIRVHYLTGKYNKLGENSILKSTSDPSVLKEAGKRTQSYENSAKNIEIAVHDLKDLITEENRIHVLSILLKKLQLCFDLHMKGSDSLDAGFQQLPPATRMFIGKDRTQKFKL